MANNLNSAARLLNILQKTANFGDGQPVVEAWAKLLGVQEERNIRRAGAVNQLLQAMQNELDIVTQSLSKSDFSASLYEGKFFQIENAISPLLLSQTWANVKQYLTPDVLTALAFCAEILPDEESGISLEELETIRRKVAELKSVLDDADTPPRLRALIQHHIELIERALGEYLVVGARALREAGRTALGEMIEAREEISTSKGSSAVTKLDALWKSVNNAADIAFKVEKAAQLGQKAWDAISNIL